MRQRPALLLFAVLITSASFSYYAASDCLRNRAVCFGADNQMAPYRYRLLEPALMRVANPSGTQENAVVGAIVLYFILTALTLPCLYIWLMRWANPDRALVGVMVYALMQVAAFHFYYLSISTAIEAMLVTLGLVMIRKRWVWFIPLVVVASLNRETALVLPLIYAAYHGRDKWREAVALVVVYGVFIAGLHIILGSSEHVLGFIGTLKYNAENIIDGVVTNLILLPLYILTIQGYRNAPPKLKRLTWLAGAYLLAIVVGAVLGEIQRLITPMLPLMLPVMISTQVLHSDTSTTNPRLKYPEP